MRRASGMTLVDVIVVVLLCAGVVVFLSQLSHSHNIPGDHNTRKCMANLDAIRKCMAGYASENGGDYPFATDNPVRWAKLYGLKFLNYFNYRNTLATRNETSRVRDWIMLVAYGSLLGLAALRLGMHGRWPLSQYEKFAYLLYVLNGAFSALFFTRIRFRIPFDFLLVTIGAIFLARCFGRWTPESKTRQPSPS